MGFLTAGTIARAFPPAPAGGASGSHTLLRENPPRRSELAVGILGMRVDRPALRQACLVWFGRGVFAAVARREYVAATPRSSRWRMAYRPPGPPRLRPKCPRLFDQEPDAGRGERS